jgi:hypothetical protein
LQEGFLSQVFSVSHVLGHLEADGIYALLVQLEEHGKSFLVTALRTLNQTAFRIVALGFGPGGDQI